MRRRHLGTRIDRLSSRRSKVVILGAQLVQPTHSYARLTVFSVNGRAERAHCVADRSCPWRLVQAPLAISGCFAASTSFALRISLTAVSKSCGLTGKWETP